MRRTANEIDVDKLFAEKYAEKEAQIKQKSSEKEGPNKGQSLASQGKLTKNDEKKSGKIQSSTYQFFFNNFGKWKIFTSWMLYIMFTLIKLAGDFWLGFWS